MTIVSAAFYHQMQTVCGNMGRNSRVMTVALGGFTSSLNILGTYQVFRTSIYADPLGFAKKVLVATAFEGFRDTHLWYLRAQKQWCRTPDEKGGERNEEKTLLSYIDVYNWNSFILAGEVKANLVVLAVVLAEWVYVTGAAKTPVRYVTSGLYSGMGPSCKMADPSDEMPGSCYLEKIEKSLADEHIGLDDWNIFWRLLGYVVYMALEIWRVRFVQIWNQKKLSAVSKPFLKQKLVEGDVSSRIAISEEKLTQAGSRLVERCSTLPKAEALSHFVGCLGIYAAMSSISLISSPYV